MKQMIKRFIDKRFYRASSLYRQFRDEKRYRNLKSYDTAFGFQLIGDLGLDSSRIDSTEAQVFEKLLADADVLIDIGANVGLFTCMAALAGKQVLAIEPQPLNIALLLKNLKQNNFDKQVEVFPLALSDAIGILPLYGGGQGATLLSGWGGIKSTYQTNVAINTLDNLCEGRFDGVKMLIKLDVEGNEYAVLKGARRLMNRSPSPSWIIEHGLTENFDGGLNPNFRALFEYFWNHGYRAFSIDTIEREILSEDVDRWLKLRRRDFGSINFKFVQE